MPCGLYLTFCGSWGRTASTSHINKISEAISIINRSQSNSRVVHSKCGTAKKAFPPFMPMEGTGHGQDFPRTSMVGCVLLKCIGCMLQLAVHVVETVEFSSLILCLACLWDYVCNEGKGTGFLKARIHCVFISCFSSCYGYQEAQLQKLPPSCSVCLAACWECLLE